MDLEKNATRTELLKTIEQQKDLIQRREQRLQDIVTAYKSLQKEKDALEASMQALSQIRSRAPREVPHSREPILKTGSEKGQESEREPKDDNNGTIEFTDPLSVSITEGASENGSGEMLEMRSQVETLSNSLLTLTQEKSKLEASYIAEKKSMKYETEDLLRKNKEISEKVEHLEKQLQQQLQEWKKRVRDQQLEREKEQTDHAVMLRELQKLLGNERLAKEHLEHQYDEVKFNLKEQENFIKELTNQHDHHTSILKDEVVALQEQLRLTEIKVQEPSPLLINLQRETEELKIQHSLILQQDQTYLENAEEAIKVSNKQSEARISELESKLSELSETVGNNERLRFQDQQTIQRLKERVSQLDLENTTLVKSSHSQPLYKNSTDIPSLVENIKQLKGQLKYANSLADHPINVEEILLDDSDTEHPLCKKYREELDQLRDEFERYKLRAQSVLKNKKESSHSREEDILKEHVNELREKLRNLHAQQEEEIEHCKQREDNLHKTMLVLQEKHKQEMILIQAEHHSQLQEFEEEMKKQRDRTVSMLAEKERELELLRESSSKRLQSDYLLQYRANPDMVGASSERQVTEDDTVVRLLTTPPAGQGEMTLLYFTQELARKDVEITSLRKQKRELEIALRDLQVSTSMRQEQLHDEIDRLKEEIRKLDRSITREGANLEYLKNVTYKFLICHDPAGKLQMLNAITTILQFSPQEKSTVQAQSRGWWATTNL